MVIVYRVLVLRLLILYFKLKCSTCWSRLAGHFSFCYLTLLFFSLFDDLMMWHFVSIDVSICFHLTPCSSFGVDRNSSQCMCTNNPQDRLSNQSVGWTMSQASKHWGKENTVSMLLLSHQCRSLALWVLERNFGSSKFLAQTDRLLCCCVGIV